MIADKLFIKEIIKILPDRLTKECFSISKKEINFIQDDEETQKCYFTKEITEGFKIINTNNKEINLFSLDGCFFASDDIKRCDGIVFNDKELCFFELKLNVVSKKGRNKRKNFNDAIEQLESTIDFFNKNNMNFFHLNEEAFICMKKNTYPTNTASKNRKKIIFLEKNKIPLFDKNIKIFN